VSEAFSVASHKGTYEVQFTDGALRKAVQPGATQHFIVDRRVADLYRNDLADVLSSPSLLLIDASEEAKSLDRFTGYVEHRIARGVRRGHVLCAIGGGVIQDITCFLAATLLRGLDWRFLPTTLLAQADSCIGSKSSINVGSAKNMLGTFTPPRRIDIDVALLATLSAAERESGLGEMLKIHAIAGPAAFDDIVAAYQQILDDQSAMLEFIRRSLLIKKRFIEEDEFDTGPRRLLNYGHSFGHAIESATEFRVPHGIAVTMGMDMANFVAVGLGCTSEHHYRCMHPALRRNYARFADEAIALDTLLSHLRKDKKITDDRLALILLDSEAKVTLQKVAPDERFRTLCQRYLSDERRA
jgi:3-dehydroquinate synthase